MGTPLRATEPTDAMLAERAAAGDDRALTALYKRHARYIAGVARRMMASDDEVDDVVQETFLIATESLASLREAGSVRAWLVRIAARRVSQRWASRSRFRRFVSALTTTAAPRSEPEPMQAIGALGRAPEALPPELRGPWVLHHVEGETLPVVAEAMSVSLATVKRRIAEASARLGEVGRVF
jgi:RNA polymerase sigma-70 factor (ECF subfamily)